MNTATSFTSPATSIDNFIDWIDEVSYNFDPKQINSKVNGYPITVIQSHYDDAALSIIGTVLQCCTRLKVHTTHSISEQIKLRQAEDRHIQDLVKMSTSHDSIRECTGFHSFKRTSTDDKIVLGPSAIGRNKDHLATSKLAESEGALAFWEDVAFWGIYSLSTDDRMHFSMQRNQWLEDKVLLAIPIDTVIDSKIWLLNQYPSQSTEVWRPIRHAWTAARESGSNALFVERLFIKKDNLQKILTIMNLEIYRSQTLVYGNKSISVNCVKWM